MNPSQFYILFLNLNNCVNHINSNSGSLKLDKIAFVHYSLMPVMDGRGGGAWGIYELSQLTIAI